MPVWVCIPPLLELLLLSFGLVCLFSDWVWGSAHIFSILLICYRSWFGLKQCNWLNLGSFPPLPLYLTLPPLWNTQILGFTIYSYREALASPTHHCSNLKHMQGKKGRGICGRRGRRTAPTVKPPCHPACMWLNTQKEREFAEFLFSTSILTGPKTLWFLIVWLILTLT